MDSLILADVMQNAGIRAGVGKLSMDISTRPSYVEASPEASVASAASFADKVHEQIAHLPPHRRLVEPVITPRFVPTCSDPLLDGLGRLSDLKSLRIQSHLAEAHDQLEWVKRERGVDDFHLFDRVRSCDCIHRLFIQHLNRLSSLPLGPFRLIALF
jgi:guanine deaminase